MLQPYHIICPQVRCFANYTIVMSSLSVHFMRSVLVLNIFTILVPSGAQGVTLSVSHSLSPLKISQALSSSQGTFLESQLKAYTSWVIQTSISKYTVYICLSLVPTCSPWWGIIIIYYYLDEVFPHGAVVCVQGRRPGELHCPGGEAHHQRLAWSTWNIWNNENISF